MTEQENSSSKYYIRILGINTRAVMESRWERVLTVKARILPMNPSDLRTCRK